MSLKMPVGWLVILALFLVGVLPSTGSFVVQLLALALLFAFGALVTFNIPRRSDIEEQRFLYWTIGVVAPLLSAINSGVYESPFHIAYSILFGVTVLLARTISTRCSFSSIATLYVDSCTLLAIALMATDPQSIAMSLNATQTSMGLYRLTPFGNHPNLAGHVFGLAGAILIARTIRSDGQRPNVATIAKLFLFLTLLLATSSRGAMIALCIASVAMFVVARPRDNTLGRGIRSRSLVLFITAIAALVLIVWKLDYFIAMLDINSSGRGVNSGGSGRLQNWSTFAGNLEETPAILFFGHGYRSWPIEEMGFDNDSSYIALIYEFGLPITIIFTVLAFRALVRSIRAFDPDSMSPEAIGVIAFAIFESFFARYLTSIGNPASLIVLISLLAVQLPNKSSTRLGSTHLSATFPERPLAKKEVTS